MTNTLRQRALGALAVLRRTSHQDKADSLKAYIEALEFQSHVALDRMTQLMERGWSLDRQQDRPWVFEPGKVYARHYRLFVYDGEVSAAEAESLWRHYAKGAAE